MLKTILVLPDGTEISSGAGMVNAVRSCTYTECVNNGTELTPGSVCANMIEVKLITPGGGLSVAAGDPFTVYKDDGTTRRKLGIFIAEKPARPTANTMILTAYDRVSLLDRDLTGWLCALTGWPYSLYDLAGMVCRECGLELTNTEIPNGSYQVSAFSGERITGRHLMQWIGQAAGRFCRATPEGKLEFAWYTPAVGHTIGAVPQKSNCPWKSDYDPQARTLTITDPAMEVNWEDSRATITSDHLHVIDTDGETVVLRGSGSHCQHFYLQGNLRYEDYAVIPIEKVQIQSSTEDVGVIWPEDAEGGNTYRITGNPLLTGDSEALRNVARILYRQMKDISYTPCAVTITANMDIQAGHIVPVADRNGRTFSVYVMTRIQSGQTDSLESTGSQSRDSVSAVTEQSYQALAGKLLNLRADVDGLRVQNKATDGRMTEVSLDVDGLHAQVQKQTADTEAVRTQLAQIQQTADSVKISVQSIRESGVSKVKTDASYTFDDNGLKIARAGEQMENLLDNTGMYVSRGGEVILQASVDGVAATDVQVRNYLCVGANARFEDYESVRTACFFTGG